MDTDWIEDILRLNTRIIAVEARLVTRVTNFVAQGAHGQATTEAETLLVADGRTLCLLRRLRNVMLDEIAG